MGKPSGSTISTQKRMSPKPAEGFTSLIEEGRSELTAEYLVVELQDRFLAEVVEAASKRLLQPWGEAARLSRHP